MPVTPMTQKFCFKGLIPKTCDFHFFGQVLGEWTGRTCLLRPYTGLNENWFQHPREPPLPPTPPLSWCNLFSSIKYALIVSMYFQIMIKSIFSFVYLLLNHHFLNLGESLVCNLRKQLAQAHAPLFYSREKSLKFSSPDPAFSNQTTVIFCNHDKLIVELMNFHVWLQNPIKNVLTWSFQNKNCKPKPMINALKNVVVVRYLKNFTLMQN